MSQRQAENEIRALGEYGWGRYEGRLWRDIPAYMRIAMACVNPGAAWRASDTILSGDQECLLWGTPCAPAAECKCHVSLIRRRHLLQ